MIVARRLCCLPQKYSTVISTLDHLEVCHAADDRDHHVSRRTSGSVSVGNFWRPFYIWSALLKSFRTINQCDDVFHTPEGFTDTSGHSRGHMDSFMNTEKVVPDKIKR